MSRNTAGLESVFADRRGIKAELRSLTNGLPSRTNVCTRRKRTCGPQDRQVKGPNRASTCRGTRGLQSYAGGGGDNPSCAGRINANA